MLNWKYGLIAFFVFLGFGQGSFGAPVCEQIFEVQVVELNPARVRDHIYQKKIYEVLQFIPFKKDGSIDDTSPLKERAIQELVQYLRNNQKMGKQKSDLNSAELYELRQAYLRVLDFLEHEARLITNETTSISADNLAVALRLILKDPLTTLSAEDSFRRGVEILKLGYKIESQLLDFLNVLRSLRIIPTVDLQYRFVKLLKNEWSKKSKVDSRDVETLSALTDVVEKIDATSAQFFGQTLSRSLMTQDRELNRVFGLSFWTLLEVSPDLALQVARQNSFVVPVEKDEWVLQRRDHQLRFVQHYFRIVKKQSARWLDEYVTSNDVIPLSLPTISKEQRLLFPKLKEFYPDVVMEKFLSEVESHVDFFVPSQNLVIELDGEVHFMRGIDGLQHSRLKDRRKDELMKASGYKVIRLTNKELLEMGIISEK